MTMFAKFWPLQKRVEYKEDLMSGKWVIKKGHIKLTILKTYNLTLHVGK